MKQGLKPTGLDPTKSITKKETSQIKKQNAEVSEDAEVPEDAQVPQAAGDLTKMIGLQEAMQKGLSAVKKAFDSDDDEGEWASAEERDPKDEWIQAVEAFYKLVKRVVQKTADFDQDQKIQALGYARDTFDEFKQCVGKAENADEIKQCAIEFIGKLSRNPVLQSAINKRKARVERSSLLSDILLA